jgi:hypothetical protein
VRGALEKVHLITEIRVSTHDLEMTNKVQEQDEYTVKPYNNHHTPQGIKRRETLRNIMIKALRC